MEQKTLETLIIRGGTSKGIYLQRAHLPEGREACDEAIVSLFGSPDPRQINGLGGGDPLTSKLGFVDKSSSPDTDIEYQSGEVGIDEGKINFSTMCGNLAAGAALFAVEQGLVERVVPETTVRIRNVNTGKRIVACIPMGEQGPILSECSEVDGVQGYGVRIEMEFKEPAGPISGHLLPTGRVLEEISVGDKRYTCSIVDCGTLYAFFRDAEFGLTGDEVPAELDLNASFKAAIEDAREAVAQAISVARGKEFKSKQIKVCLLSNYDCSTNGQKHCTVTVAAKVINKYKTHKAFPVTGAICLSAASAISGSILNQALPEGVECCRTVIHHPTGSMEVKSQLARSAQGVTIVASTLARSARLLMRGAGFYIEKK